MDNGREKKKRDIDKDKHNAQKYKEEKQRKERERDRKKRTAVESKQLILRAMGNASCSQWNKLFYGFLWKCTKPILHYACLSGMQIAF